MNPPRWVGAEQKHVGAAFGDPLGEASEPSPDRVGRTVPA